MENSAKKEGQTAADRMVSGEQMLQKSIDEFKIGAVKGGCPEALANFIEFGFWMGANATLTRAMAMMEACESGDDSGNRVSNLMDEIAEGLDAIDTGKLFRPFQP
jgi:hypothetical protein